jgi:hypothetical protein
MPLTPQQVADAWAQGLANATTKMTNSVANLTTSPTSQAAAAVQTWIARLNDPKTQQKWQAKLNAVTLSQWQAAYTQKGIQRVSQGAQVAKNQKMVPFFTKWLPYEAAGQQQVKNMPKATLQDRIARAVFMINYNSQFTYP